MKNVSEPTTPTEFEVQATLWSKLRELGINVRGEVKARYEKRTTVRFDLSVFKNGKLQGIIEVKKSPVNHKTTWLDTRQGSRYVTFGVPVCIVYGMDEANMLIDKAKNGQSLF